MTNAPPQSDAKPTIDEISLENIDRLLQEEDPEFTQSLDEVRAVEVDPSVNIETSAIEEAEKAIGGDEKPLERKPAGFFAELNSRFRMARLRFRNRVREKLVHAGKSAVIFLKTKPKEYLLFSFSMLKVLVSRSMVPLRAFQEASWGGRIAYLFLVGVVVGAGWVLIHNFKGVWLPSLNEPILSSFEPYADFVEELDPKDQGESFYSAFPQERHEFLFTKMKVNLRATADNPLPMGAFEIIVDLDSSDTSIEVRDREVEFRDLLQRTLEEETFNDLETELGKTKLKSSIKRELNQKLTQGWVRDVSFRTFVLKP